MTRVYRLFECGQEGARAYKIQFQSKRGHWKNATASIFKRDRAEQLLADFERMEGYHV